VTGVGVADLGGSGPVLAATGFAAGLLAQVPESVPLAMIAGLAGGLCAALADWIVDAQPLGWRAMGHATIGAFTAGFLYPLGQPIAAEVLGRFEVDPGIGVMFGGFMMGVMGLSVIVMIRDAARARLKSRIRGAGGDDEPRQ